MYSRKARGAEIKAKAWIRQARSTEIEVKA
jgi:hypothetical protein